ncbi:MAG TPA: hypothetical protein PKV33_11735, partial [Methanothrix sp.]|nr:hypothetical protein [Methanothrix sp.]
MRYNIHKMGFILMITMLLAALSAGCKGMADQKNNADTTGADMTAKEAYSRLLNASQEIAYIDTMITLSQWDQDIYMPQNATKYRSKAQSYMED